MPVQSTSQFCNLRVFFLNFFSISLSTSFDSCMHTHFYWDTKRSSNNWYLYRVSILAIFSTELWNQHRSMHVFNEKDAHQYHSQHIDYAELFPNYLLFRFNKHSLISILSNRQNRTGAHFVMQSTKVESMTLHVLL